MKKKFVIKMMFLLIFFNLINSVDAEIFFGMGYTNDYISNTENTRSGGMCFLGGVRQSLVNHFYGKLGGELSLSSKTDYLGPSFGIGLPVYRTSNSFWFVETGGIYSIWATSLKHEINGERIDSGKNFLPFINIGYYWSDVCWGIECEYRFGDNKNAPSGFSISLVYQTKDLDRFGKSIFLKTQEEVAYKIELEEERQNLEKAKNYIKNAKQYKINTQYDFAIKYYLKAQLIISNKDIQYTINQDLSAIKSILIQEGFQLYEGNEYVESLSKFELLKLLKEYISEEESNKINNAKLIIGEKYLLNSETNKEGIRILLELVNIPNETGLKAQNILSVYDFNESQKKEKEEDKLKYLYWIISVYNPQTNGVKLANEEVKKYENPIFEEVRVLGSKKKYQEAINLLNEKIVVYTTQNTLANQKINELSNIIEEEERKKEAVKKQREIEQEEKKEKERLKKAEQKIQAWTTIMQAGYSAYGITLSARGDMLIIKGTISVLSQLPLSDIMESIGLLGGRWIRLVSLSGSTYETIPIPKQFRKEDD